MQKTITTFNFDRAKAGKVMKQFIADSEYSQSQVAQMAGITDDMMSNVLAGRNKDIGFERVFKICVITGHSICEFIRLMLENEDVDFFDKNGCVICHPQKTEVIPQITAQNVKMEEQGFSGEAFNRYVERSEKLSESNMERFRRIHEENRREAAEQYKASIARYEHQIQIINQEHKTAVDEMKASHAETVSLLKAQNKRLRCTAWIMFGLFMAETLAILGLFAYDAIHPDRGWLQYMASMLKNHNSTDYIMRG